MAIIDLESKRTTLADVGRYPYGVVADPRRPRVYVTNERDGAVSVIEVPSGRRVATIAVGDPRNDYAHPEGISVDPIRDRAYVAVTDRDLVAVLDTAALKLERYVDVGRAGAGNQPFSDDGRPTYGAVQTATDPSFPSQVQGTCRSAAPSPPGTPNAVRCTTDAGEVGLTRGAPATLSRMRSFAAQFRQQVAANAVPAFNYLILFNDHTDGTSPGVYTPKANVADNDLALGQLVELVSQSPIWKDSAILVIEDDSQDGIDSVDAHRIPAFVISPWAKRGGTVVSTRFDQYSYLRTAELMLGLRPLSINDALATPLYDAFISGSERPDVEGTRYRAIQPQQSLTEVNPPDAPNARLSAQLPFDQVDRVPQRLSDRIIWQSVFGPDSTPPPPGPNASPAERARATGALARLRAGRSPRAFLLGEGGESEEEEEAEEAREEAVTQLRRVALP